MSKETIAEKSLIIRIETEPAMNTNKRVADVLDDINETMLEAPQGSGFYYLSTGGMEPTWTPINPTSYFVPIWNGSTFQASSIYYNQNSGRIVIGTGNTILNYLLEVNGSAKVNNLVISNPANAQGDATFTKTFVGRTDGTVGWVDRTDTISSGTTVLNTSGFPNIFAYRNTINMKNSFVHIYLDLNLGDQPSSNWSILGVIPAQFRPAQNTLMPGWLTYTMNGSQTRKVTLYMIEYSTGNVSMMEPIPGGATGVGLTISTQYVKMN
jgi:hypothetical protein